MIRFLVLTTCLVLTTAAQAKEYSIKDIVKKYIDYAPQLKAARSSYMAAHYDKRKAVSKFFPNVSLNGSITEYENPRISSFPGVSTTGKQYLGSLDVTQPLFAGGALWRGLTLANLNKSLQEQTYLQTKQESLASIIGAALQLAALKEQIRVLEESQKYQERFFKLTQSKAQRGAAKNFEVSQARAGFLAYTPRIANVKQQILDAQNILKVNLGLAANDEIEVSMPALFKVEPTEMDKLLEQASQNRPNLKMAELTAEIAREQKWLNLSDELPSLSLVGSIGYKSPTQSDFSKDSTEFHSISLALKIPLFSGLSSIHKYQSGSESVRASEEKLTSERNTLRQEVQKAYEGLMTARDVVTSTGEWATEARKALNSSIDSYKIGIITSAQVIQVQSGWESAEVSLVQAKTAYQSALLALRKSLGVDLEKVYTEN